MKFICVDDYEQEALRRMPREALDYYRSGADEEITLRANRESFKKFKIMPRFLRDVSSIKLDTSILNQRFKFPIGVSPSAMHKLAHPEGELATASGILQAGSMMILSTLSTTSIEDLASKYPQLNKWFQLYLFKDRNESLKLVKRAEKAGFKAIVLTVDAPQFGTRRRDLRNNFKVGADFVANFDQKSAQGLKNLDYIDPSIKWTDVAWLHEVTKLPIIIKGIMTPEDSVMAIKSGASAIIVSNHGGRQLDGVPATIDVLGSITKAVNGRMPVMVDGGVRTGSDVFKCLALGAKMVFVGRPVLWGLACEGAHGVRRVLEILREELELTMRLSGCASLHDITPEMIIHESRLVSKL